MTGEVNNIFRAESKKGSVIVDNKHFVNCALDVNGAVSVVFVNGLLYAIHDMKLIRMYELEFLYRQVVVVGNVFYFNGKYFYCLDNFSDSNPVHTETLMQTFDGVALSIDGIKVVEVSGQQQGIGKQVLGWVGTVQACGNYLCLNGNHYLANTFDYDDGKIRKFSTNMNRDGSITAFIGNQYVTFYPVDKQLIS